MSRTLNLSKLSVLTIALAVVFAFAAPASAVTYWYVDTNGLWTVAANWDLDGNVEAGSLPGSGDVVRISNNRTVTFAAAAGTATISQLRLGYDGSTGWQNGQGYFVMTGGKLIVSGNIIMKDNNTNGRITLNGGHLQAANLILNDQDEIGGDGRFTLGGGTLEVNSIQMTGTGNDGDFRYNSGVLLVSGDIRTYNLRLGFTAGSNVTWTFSNNIRTENASRIGNSGNAKFIQTGGVFTQDDTGNLTIAYNATSTATYVLEEGQINCNDRFAVGRNGNGYFYQYGGNVQVGVTTSKTMAIGDNLAGFGYYELNNATSSLRVRDGDLHIGEGGAGSHGVLMVKAGTVKMHGTTNDINLGQTAGSTGTVFLEGGLIDLDNGSVDVGANATGTGLLAISGGELNIDGGTNLNVGLNGAGVMTMSGGVANIGDFIVAYNAGSTGDVTLTDGTINVSGDYQTDIGRAGAGTMTHSGGTLNTTQGSLSTTSALNVGMLDGGVGTYNLSGAGVLNVDGNVMVGQSGTGVFNYTGGELSADGIILGNGETGMGTFNLGSGADLTVTKDVFIGVGGEAAFNGTGGGLTARVVQIGDDGAMSMTAGSMSIDSLLSVGAQTLDLGSGATGVTASGMVDLSDVTVTNGASATLTTGANSLVLVDTGSEPGDFFGTTAISGTTYYVGTALSLGTGVGFGGAGTIRDSLTTDGGDILATEDWFIHLKGGLTQVGGNIDLGSGDLEGGLSMTGGTLTSTGDLIVNETSSITNATLSYGSILVGTTGDGQLTQTNSNVTVTSANSFVLGQTAGTTGSYLLSSGTLDNSITTPLIGDAGKGVFLHTGGTHLSKGMTLGNTAGGEGTYRLSDGLLDAGSGTQIIAGFKGGPSDPASLFHQTGGTVKLTGSNILIGSEGVGTWILEDGLVQGGHDAGHRARQRR